MISQENLTVSVSLYELSYTETKPSQIIPRVIANPKIVDKTVFRQAAVAESLKYAHDAIKKPVTIYQRYKSKRSIVASANLPNISMGKYILTDKYYTNKLGMMEELLKKYNSMLVEKNKALNLTAHKTEEDSWVNNIQDSLLFLNEFPAKGKCMDLGSGCGCPAIPLKLALPELYITMVDSVNKKVEFLNESVKALNLENIKAIHTRIEDFKFYETFDFVTARAVAPLPTLLEYALPFLKVGGLCFAFKGSKWQDEINASQNALRLLGGKVKDIKLHGETRSLIIIEKVKPTDRKYPRNKNLPRLKPL